MAKITSPKNMNTEIWNSSKMAGTGGALKALTKNLANQLTLNRSEMKRVVARVISERHGQGDVGDYNGHMFFVKPERIDLTEQITHSKEAFDDMIQQKRMRLCSSRHNLYRSPSNTRSRSLKMTMRSPAANKSLTGVIIDQRHLPKRGNPPEIVVQISKGKSRGQSKRVPVTLSPPPVRAKTSLRRLPSRSKSLLIGSKAKLKVGTKKRLLKAKFVRAKKPATASSHRLHELHKQHQQLQQQLQLQQLQEQQQAKLEQQLAKLQPPESTPNNGQRLEAGAKATLAVEKAQSLVEELANSSVTLCHEKSMAAVQPVVIKKKSNNLLKKKYSSKMLPKAKSRIISRKKKLYHSNNSNNSNSNSNNVRSNYNSSSNNNRNRNHNNNNNNNSCSNSNSNRNKSFGNKSYRNNSFGFRNAGNRLQAGGLMAEASKLGIRTPAIDRYTKYWRHPYQFPGGAGATQMYDTAREKYAVASAKAKLLVRRKQVAAALYTNFQRQQQSSMNLRRIRKKQSRARLLRQMKRDEAIDDPDNLETHSSKRCLKRRKRTYKISPRLEALAKPVHRTKVKSTVHRHCLRQEVSIPSSLGSMANLKRGTSRSGLTPAKRNLTLAFLNREESAHSPRSRRSAIWR